MNRFIHFLLVLFFTNYFLYANEGYKIGDIASDFYLKNIDNTMISLSDYENVKGFIIIFTCNTCPYANKYDERINDLNIKYEPLGFPVIAIMPNDPIIQPGDSFEKMKIAAIDKDYTFPYLIDEGQNVYPQYGATKTPHTYLLHVTEKGNEVVYIGAIDDNYKDSNLVKIKYLENAINSLISDKEIKVKETRAIGCTIKF
mgnify:CR=1 FL=1|tara:strand:- start:164 stop:763 length:600 start_codon:yes stop_codon:yes gene_type:complete